MKPWGRHIATLIVVFMAALGLRAQEEVCTIEDGRLVFHLRTDWTDEEREDISERFGLDSLLLDEVFSSTSEGPFQFEGDSWQVARSSDGVIHLSKNMDELSGQMDLKADMILSPNAPGSGISGGPGYVDVENTIFGVNRLKENVIVQYPNGKTKLRLPDHEDAEMVVVSGSFNGWSTSGFPMAKTSDGWEIELNLSPGKYLYKFIADGQWIKAEGNALYESDGWGGKNSVLYRYNYKFELEGYTNAKKVFVAGSFNNWNEKQLRMTRSKNGWILPIYLKEGTHSYKFIVDGEWITDPENPVIRPDGGGNFNSVLALGDTTMFRLNGYTDANDVRLAGSFNAWNPAELGMKKIAGGWELPYVLARGNYEYKFVVDGEWITDPGNPYTIYHGDYENSFLAIKPNQAFNLLGFPDASEVIVTGNFTGWSTENNRMIKRKGEWIFPIYLKPGKYVYKYIVDGEWILDPENPDYEQNEFNTDNSVLWVEPEGPDRPGF